MSQETWNRLEKSYKEGIINGTVIADIWQLDDVLGRAEEMEYELTEKQAKDVLSLLYNKSDANIGINWDTVDSWISEVIHE